MQKNVILIDRDRIRRGKLQDLLSKAGFQVWEFDAGKEAVNHLLFESVNAVVVDYGSAYERENPLAGGRIVVRECVNVDAFVPLLLICDRCEKLDHETAAAADLVLRRPVTERQVTDGLKTVLEETLRERAQRKSGYIFAFR